MVDSEEIVDFLSKVVEEEGSMKKSTQVFLYILFFPLIFFFTLPFSEHFTDFLSVLYLFSSIITIISSSLLLLFFLYFFQRSGESGQMKSWFVILS